VGFPFHRPPPTPQRSLVSDHSLSPFLNRIRSLRQGLLSQTFRERFPLIALMDPLGHSFAVPSSLLSLIKRGDFLFAFRVELFPRCVGQSFFANSSSVKCLYFFAWLSSDGGATASFQVQAQVLPFNFREKLCECWVRAPCIPARRTDLRLLLLTILLLPLVPKGDTAQGSRAQPFNRPVGHRPLLPLFSLASERPVYQPFPISSNFPYRLGLRLGVLMLLLSTPFRGFFFFFSPSPLRRFSCCVFC